MGADGLALGSIASPHRHIHARIVDDGSNARQDLGEDGWRVWRASYENATGRMSVRGPDGTITERETDARGRLASVVERSADDAVTVRHDYDWSADDRRLTYTVSPAATASGEYRQTSFFSPLGVPTRLEDSTGEVLSWMTGTGAERALTDGLGHTWQYAYDAAHRLTSVTHPDGSSESRSYFVGSDDVRYATDRTGNTTTFEYDAWGNVRRRQGTAVAVTLGARPDARRRRDREVRYVYDTLGLREATALNDPADPLDDVRQTFVRDSLGRTVSESDARFADTLNLERDAMGRPTRINFGNEAWSRDYDAWGRLMQATARARRGGSTSGSRPSQGGQSGQTTNVARFEYAGLGQPSTVRFGNGAIEMRTFDEEGRRLTGTLMPSSVSGAQPIYQHALYYGTDGHLVRFDQHIAGRTPFSQLFTSDALGRLEGASGHVTGMPAMVSGEISSETLRSYHSDPRAQPVPLPSAGNAGAGSGSGSGSGSNSGSNSGSGSGSSLGSGGGAPSTWVPESSRFTYDAADNLRTFETPDGVMSPSIGLDNRYTSFGYVQSDDVGGDDLASDADGRLTHLGVNTFSYDAFGDMVERTDDRDGSSWRFLYDAFGQLAGGVDSNGHVFALRRADGWIVEHRDLGTGVSTVYVPGPEPNTAPLAVASGNGGLVYNHAPWGERVMLMTDDRGRIAASYAWSAYGEPSSTSSSFSSSISSSPFESGADALLLLGGQPYFGDIGLHRFGHRWYSPGLGRFLSQDPLGFVDGANRYLYAGGQPIDFYDPLGLERRRAQRERSRAFMWALRGDQGLRDWETSRAWGRELMQRHEGDAAYYRVHGHYRDSTRRLRFRS
ncbi:MAG: hypothetical protein IPK13_12405 [Deltaproteobacteria bacterium]|nr:hypothetical protein [Deltaproteobacteria bacterium]